MAGSAKWGSLAKGSLWFIWPNCGLGLIGLVVQGSIPRASACLMALLLLVVLRLVGLKLTTSVWMKNRRYTMKGQRHHLELFGYSVLEALWAIGTSTTASALPARFHNYVRSTQV
jgi:hypothetical protein